MFPENRQIKLNPTLAALRAIPGIASVHQDDFDSAGINVFIDLKRNGIRMSEPLRSTKARIRKACKDVGFDFLDCPTPRYNVVPASFGFPREKIFQGYDKNSIKIVVYI